MLSETYLKTRGINHNRKIVCHVSYSDSRENEFGFH